MFQCDLCINIILKSTQLVHYTVIQTDAFKTSHSAMLLT